MTLGPAFAKPVAIGRGPYTSRHDRYLREAAGWIVSGHCSWRLDFSERSAVGRLRRVFALVLTHEARAADNVGGERRALFRDSGLAHAFENGLKLGQIRRVVAHRRPSGAGAGDGEGGVERETGFDGGTRLAWPAKLREGGAQHKM